MAAVSIPCTSTGTGNWHHQNIPQIHTSGSVQMSLSEAPDQRVLISIFRTISPTYCTRHRTGLYHSERIASSGECMPIVSSTNKGIHILGVIFRFRLLRRRTGSVHKQSRQSNGHHRGFSFHDNHNVKLMLQI